MSTSDRPSPVGGLAPTEPATAAPAAPDRMEERWAYGGLRVLRGKRVHAWLREAGHGQELLYAMTGTFAIGEIYRATVSTTDAKVTMHGTPRHAADGRVDADLAARLRAEHHAAQARLSLARMERPAGRRDELDEALEPLRAIVRQLPTRADVTAFIAYVLRELAAPGPAPAGLKRPEGRR